MRSVRNLLLLGGLLIRLLCQESSALAQPPDARAGSWVDPAPLATEVLELKSSAGREYRVYISRPEGEPPRDGYASLYLLDGNAYFGPCVQARQRLPKAEQSFLIVGIGYPVAAAIDVSRRTYDLTPPAAAEKLPPRRGGKWPKWGGADQFADFIKLQLRPLVDEKYSTDASSRAVFGHSFGGLFTLHTLIHHPGDFDCYLASSPSIWWNDYAVHLQEPSLVTTLQRHDPAVRLYLSAGEEEVSGEVKGPASALAPTPSSRACGTTRDFAQRLSQQGLPKSRFDYTIVPGASHGSVAPIALDNALHFWLQIER